MNCLEVIKIVIPTAIISSTLGFLTSTLVFGATLVRREQDAFQRGLDKGRNEVESKVKEDIMNKIEKLLSKN